MTAERKTLREWRLSRFMTQEELRQAAGVSLATVNAWEMGRKQPRLSSMRKAAEALGVHPSQIIWAEASKKAAA